MKQKDITEYIDQKLIEWKGKTIADNDHFQNELKKTLIDVALFTIADIRKDIDKPNTQ